MAVHEDFPASGAVFIFGSSKVADVTSNCFWLKNDEVVSGSCGDEHTALVTRRGRLYVFGSNNWGQLGLGSTHAAQKPTCVQFFKEHEVRSVACGRNHTLVSTSDNTIFAFGNNNDSQLGIIGLDSSNIPIRIEFNFGKIIQVTAGADFSLAVTTEGSVFTWGSNAEGQLGLGRHVNEVKVPTLVQGLEPIQYAACGYYHTVVLSRTGKLYTFGEDEFGKLGDRDPIDTSLPGVIRLSVPTQVKKIECGGSHTTFLTQNNELHSFGSGIHGELGHGTSVLQTQEPKLIDALKGHEITQMSCGENFTSAVTKTGKLFTFGDGKHGKLAGGEENFTNHFTPFHCKRFDKYIVKFAVCGGCHMVVLAAKRPASVNLESSFHGENTGEVSMVTIHEDLKSADSEMQLGNSLAREKRRQSKKKLMSEMLPPTRTEELVKAATSLPRSNSLAHNHMSVEHRAARRSIDETSEISSFNKVHRLIKDGEMNAFMPVKICPPSLNQPDAVDTRDSFGEEDSPGDVDATQLISKDCKPQTKGSSHYNSETKSEESLPESDQASVIKRDGEESPTNLRDKTESGVVMDSETSEVALSETNNVKMGEVTELPVSSGAKNSESATPALQTKEIKKSKLCSIL